MRDLSPKIVDLIHNSYYTNKISQMNRERFFFMVSFCKTKEDLEKVYDVIRKIIEDGGGEEAFWKNNPPYYTSQ